MAPVGRRSPGLVLFFTYCLILGRNIDDLRPQQRVLEIGLCVVGILSMRGKDQGDLDPVIVPLDLALEVPLLGQVNGCGAHSFMFCIRDDALRELFRAFGRSAFGPRGFGRGRFGCGGRFSRGGRSRNARLSNGARRRSRGTGSAGRRTTAWVRSQTGGLFAPIRQRILVLLEAGHDSAAARLHSRAQLLCIVCAGGANRSKLILRQRRLRRGGGADNQQYSQTSHREHLKVPINGVKSTVQWCEK